MTSNFNEGWGAVLNESMSSGCAVISSHAAGSAPYLIENNVNGLLYKSGDINELTTHIAYLLDNPDKTYEFGKKAYETLHNTWSPKVAATRFISLASGILDNSIPNYADGPCSRAPIIKNTWYKDSK